MSNSLSSIFYLLLCIEHLFQSNSACTQHFASTNSCAALHISDVSFLLTSFLPFSSLTSHSSLFTTYFPGLLSSLPSLLRLDSTYLSVYRISPLMALLCIVCGSELQVFLSCLPTLCQYSLPLKCGFRKMQNYGV